MIGADETTANDKHGNAVFIRRGPYAAQAIAQIVAAYGVAGFTVHGTTIEATRSEIEAAWSRVMVRL